VTNIYFSCAVALEESLLALMNVYHAYIHMDIHTYL